MAPVISDFFTRFYISHYITDKDELNLYHLITHDFCQWMKEMKLTGVHITMEEKYELKNKKFFEIVHSAKKAETKRGAPRKKHKIGDNEGKNKKN